MSACLNALKRKLQEAADEHAEIKAEEERATKRTSESTNKIRAIKDELLQCTRRACLGRIGELQDQKVLVPVVVDVFWKAQDGGTSNYFQIQLVDGDILKNGHVIGNVLKSPPLDMDLFARHVGEHGERPANPSDHVPADA
jgi:hypothetical protein